MARKGAVLAAKEAVPILEQFKGYKCGATSVGVTATALPATNLTGRKGILIQNVHATQTLYVGGNTIPESIIGSYHGLTDTAHTVKYKDVEWKLSAGGTNEWYAVARGGTTAGFTEPVVVYYATVGGGTETVATNGTVGSLAAEHGWDWGDGDTLGFSTIYVRTDGAVPASNPVRMYDAILSYTAVPTSVTAIALGPLDAVYMSLDGSARVFAIGSGAATTAITMEYV